MQSHQLLIVTTPEWRAMMGSMALYERNETVWAHVGSFPVVLGKSGMAWGIGLHPAQKGAQKREGDGKSPAGIFRLGPAFGQLPASKMDYLSITSDMEAVDDPDSRFYNQIVKRGETANCDWKSSEKMAEIPLYELGLIVHHNFPHPLPGAGSAIFMHIWSGAQTGTAGCTAMSRKNLAWLLSWLDKEKNPLLVQLPVSEYARLQDAWKLPCLNQSASTASQKRSNSSSVL